jgi:hypothetical protein
MSYRENYEAARGRGSQGNDDPGANLHSGHHHLQGDTGTHHLQGGTGNHPARLSRHRSVRRRVRRSQTRAVSPSAHPPPSQRHYRRPRLSTEAPPIAIVEADVSGSLLIDTRLGRAFTVISGTSSPLCVALFTLLTMVNFTMTVVHIFTRCVGRGHSFRDEACTHGDVLRIIVLPLVATLGQTVFRVWFAALGRKRLDREILVPLPLVAYLRAAPRRRHNRKWWSMAASCIVIPAVVGLTFIDRQWADLGTVSSSIALTFGAFGVLTLCVVVFISITEDADRFGILLRAFTVVFFDPGHNASANTHRAAASAAAASAAAGAETASARKLGTAAAEFHAHDHDDDDVAAVGALNHPLHVLIAAHQELIKAIHAGVSMWGTLIAFAAFCAFMVLGLVGYIIFFARTPLPVEFAVVALSVFALVAIPAPLVFVNDNNVELIKLVAVQGRLGFLQYLAVHRAEWTLFGFAFTTPVIARLAGSAGTALLLAAAQRLIQINQ